jgi:hypothetical protein
MKKTLLIISIFLFAAIIWAASTPDRAATDELNRFLNSITAQQLQNFGFSNASELAKVKIEPCFSMQSLSADKISQGSLNMDKNTFIQDSLKLYPLSVNGKYKCMLAVDYTKGEWKAVSIGYKELAEQMELIRQTCSKEIITLIRVYPFKRYYYTVSNSSLPNCNLIYIDNPAPDYNRLTPLSHTMQDMQVELSKTTQGANHEN